jgi:hypothetical protein
MFNENEDVIVKSVNRKGLIVDKVTYNGYAEYIVEDYTWENNEYPLYHCVDADLERIPV